MTLLKRLVSLLLIYCFVVAAAPHTRAEIPPANLVSVDSSNPAPAPSTFGRAFDFLSSLFAPNSTTSSDDEAADKEEGLRFRLSEALEQPEARPVSKLANTTPLSDADTEAILRRLPPIKTEPSDEAEFAWREKHLQPPRTGATA